MLQIGENAPGFKLHSADGGLVELSSFKGKNVVLLFFPLANTGVCTKELCSFRDGLARYNSLNAQVLAVSVDSPFSLKLWKEQQKFNFPLLSDFNKETIAKYDAMYETFVPGELDFHGVAKRSAFVIDKSGILQYVEVLENAGDEPNYEKITAALEKLQ